MKTLTLFLIVCCLGWMSVRAESVYILHDATVPQAAYAARKLSEALKDGKHVVLAKRTGYDRLVSLAVNPSRLKAEAFAIVPEGKVITVYGGD